MNSVFFFAYKDIIRQKKLVSLVVIMLILGITNVMFTLGLIEGIVDNFVALAIGLSIGHVSIIPYEGHNYIEDLNNVESKLENIPNIVSITPRLEDNGNIIKLDGNYNCQIIGISPQTERENTPLENRIIEGNYMSAKNEVLIGKYIAEDRDIMVGDSIILRFSNGFEKNVYVVGLISSGIYSIDGRSIFADYDLVSESLNIKNKASNILVKISDPDKANMIETEIKQNGIGNAQSWMKLSESAQQSMSMQATIATIISGIAIIAASIGIAILIYINILHRTRQIGVLKAIGARSRFIMAIFLTETIFIASLGIIVGLLASFLLVTYFQANPIYDAGADMYLQINYSISIIMPTVCSVLLFSLAAGIYPAWKASRLDVVEVLRNE